MSLGPFDDRRWYVARHNPDEQALKAFASAAYVSVIPVSALTLGDSGTMAAATQYTDAVEWSWTFEGVPPGHEWALRRVTIDLPTSLGEYAVSPNYAGGAGGSAFIQTGAPAAMQTYPTLLSNGLRVLLQTDDTDTVATPPPAGSVLPGFSTFASLDPPIVLEAGDYLTIVAQVSVPWEHNGSGFSAVLERLFPAIAPATASPGQQATVYYTDQDLNAASS